MKWDKREIDIQQLNKFYETCMEMLKAGKDIFNHTYCVIKYTDTDILQMLFIFDFLDYYHDEVIEKDTISKLYCCQPFT